MVDTIAAGAATTPIATPPSASQKLDEQYRQFLTLLTAQISNQDPLEPMDSSQFVTQLAQISQVEQGVVTNQNLESMLSRLTEVSARADLEMIGREVLVPSRTATLSEEAFDGFVEVADGAAKVEVNIHGADGTVVRTLSLGGIEAGSPVAVQWDGNDASGWPVAYGPVRFEVVATDAQGEAVEAETLARARVEGLSFTEAGPELHLGTGERIGSMAVRSVL